MLDNNNPSKIIDWLLPRTGRIIGHSLLGVPYVRWHAGDTEYLQHNYSSQKHCGKRRFEIASQA